MGGGLLQLVAYGAQDIYLTGNPQVTFFKVVYRRHTNFAIEAIQQTFNGNADFGRRITSQISRNGDLIHRMYLEVAMPALTGEYVPYVGLRLLKSVEIEIGGQRIDKHYSDFMYIWNELTLPHGKRAGYDKMVGKTVTGATTLFVPLEFWFCRNVGLALPLIALQYHEVKVNIELASLKELTVGDAEVSEGADLDVKMWVDYIFLDTDERRRFAQLSHEYLIEQLQFTGDESLKGRNERVKLNFNHPVKELIWVVTSGSDAGEWNKYSVESADNDEVHLNPVSMAKLQLNGQDRFAERSGDYFNLVQPYQHHENVSENVGINVYSFALKPEEHQPSGTLNFSRVDTAVLNLTLVSDLENAMLKTYAINYNVLRIMSGMGGLAYSN